MLMRRGGARLSECVGGNSEEASVEIEDNVDDGSDDHPRLANNVTHRDITVTAPPLSARRHTTYVCLDSSVVLTLRHTMISLK